MPKTKPTLAILLILITLSSCAALQITTWIVKQGVFVHGVDTKSLVEAEGFRCYSKADDTAWREELKLQTACCGAR